MSLPLTSSVLDKIIIFSSVRYYSKWNLQEIQVKSRNLTEPLLNNVKGFLKYCITEACYCKEIKSVSQIMLNTSRKFYVHMYATV